MKVAIFGDSVIAQACSKELSDRRVPFVHAEDVSKIQGSNACIIAPNQAYGDMSITAHVRWLRSILDRCVVEAVQRVVFVSSITTMGNRSPLSADQYLALNDEHDPYFCVPFAMEQEVYRYMNAGLQIVPVLASLAILKGEDDLGLLGFIQRSKVLPANAGVDLVDARDVARGIVQAERTGRAGRRYPLTGRFVMLPDLADALKAKPKFIGGSGTGRKVLIRMMPRIATSQLQPAVPFLHGLKVDDDRARGELGYRARDPLRVVQPD